MEKKFINYNVEIINEDNLQRYPIPNMEDVLIRFLEWGEPLLNRIDYWDAKNSVKKFLESDLSTILEEKMNELGNRENDSWIFDYWVKAHLKVRKPLTPHTNVPILYENKDLEGYDPLEKMAIIMHAVTSVYKVFKEEGARAYTLNRKRYSADQFHGLLASMNHIQEEMDSYYINDECSENIVFLYQNRHYNIPVIVENQVVSANQIYCLLRNITQREVAPRIPNLNYVTVGVDRNKSAQVLEQSLELSENRKSYEQIKNAIMVMNFDDHSSKTKIEALDQASYNRTCVNRWHGKGLQFSCSKTGELSLIVDHSFVDGGTEIYLVDRIRNIIESKNFKFEKKESCLEFEELEFRLTDELKDELLSLKNEFDRCMDEFQTHHMEMPFLKRSTLKENGVLSGDGFLHLAFQAAQYKTFGEIYNTYISVDARSFFKGRTEVNRPVSNESVKFATSLFAEQCNDETLKRLMHDALNEHHKRTKQCQAGNGVNRYLYVLENVFEDNKHQFHNAERPELFDKKAFEIIAQNRLSTTGFNHDDLQGLYFPPVVEDGFGIYYWVGEESYMIITAYSDYVGQMNSFIEHLESVVLRMIGLITTK